MVNAQVFSVSAVDRDGEFFPDGSEQFGLRVNVVRADPLWDALFSGMRDQTSVPLAIPVALFGAGASPAGAFDPSATVERLGEVTHEAWVRDPQVHYTATEASKVEAFQVAALDQGWAVEFDGESGQWQAKRREPGTF